MQNRIPMTTGPCSAKKLSQRTIVNTVYSVCSNVFMPTNLDAIPMRALDSSLNLGPGELAAAHFLCLESPSIAQIVIKNPEFSMVSWIDA